MELEFVKLIRVQCVITLPGGGVVVAYRYMDMDGNIIAETVDGVDYPSSVRELEQKVRLEAPALQEGENPPFIETKTP